MNSQINRLIGRAVLQTIECTKETHFPFVLREHTASSCTVYYLRSGSAVFRLQNREYEMKGGMLAVAPAELPHDFLLEADTAAEVWLWSFQYRIDRVLDVFSLISHPRVFALPNTPSFETVFSHYTALLHQERTLPEEIRLQSMGLELMACLFTGMMEKMKGVPLTGSTPAVFHEILLQILDHPEAGVSLKELSLQYHMHPTYISNRFKYHLGVTPAQLHRSVILEQAKSLLMKNDLTITEISARLGFGDVSSFTQFFHDLTGESPSQFRKRVREECDSAEGNPLNNRRDKE